MGDQENKSTADEQLGMMRHSASHILASSVKSLFPEAKFGICPAIENGFYYDLELPRPLTPEDLPKIEEKMREMIKNGLAFTQENISKAAAQALFKDQPYKL